MPRFAGSDHDRQLPSISRRQWLAEAGAVCGALGATGLLPAEFASAQDKPAAQGKPASQNQPAVTAVDPNGYIDAHVHVWTPDVKKYPLAPGFKPADMKPPSFTPEELFAHARPCGVSRIVLIQMSFYKYDNSYMLDAMKAFPGVFSGVAIVDHSQNDVVAKMRDLAKQGVRGFRLAPFAEDPAKYFAAKGIDAMWRTGAEDNLKMCLLINPGALPVVDKLCEKHPDTPVVIDHFARIGADGKISDNDVVSLCRLAKHKNTYVKVSAFYALGKKATPYADLLPMITLLKESYGPQRLMWASDCPFQVQAGHNYRDSIDLILKRARFLSDDDRKQMLTKTAEKVFFA
jgi:predicted TIM-barrel fold metal-dependent hydrolase